MRLELPLPKVPSGRAGFFFDEEGLSCDSSILSGSKDGGEEPEDEDGSEESGDDEEDDALMIDINKQHIDKTRKSNRCIHPFCGFSQVQMSVRGNGRKRGAEFSTLKILIADFIASRGHKIAHP